MLYFFLFLLGGSFSQFSSAGFMCVNPEWASLSASVGRREKIKWALSAMFSFPPFPIKLVGLAIFHALQISLVRQEWNILEKSQSYFYITGQRFIVENSKYDKSSTEYSCAGWNSMLQRRLLRGKYFTYFFIR